MRSRATTARGVLCGGGSIVLKEPVPARSPAGAASLHPCRGRNGTTVARPTGFRPAPIARQRGEIKRLVEPDQVRVRARRQIGKAGGQDDRQVRLLGFDARGQLSARHVRHGLVGENQVDGPAARENGEGVLSGVGLDDEVPQILQHRGHVGQSQRIVINDKNCEQPGGHQPPG